jgi:hypothetical protein
MVIGIPERGFSPTIPPLEGPTFSRWKHDAPERSDEPLLPPPYSYDISRAGTKNITEILVDTSTGAIVSQATETPAQQKKEALEDAAKAR